MRVKSPSFTSQLAPRPYIANPSPPLSNLCIACHRLASLTSSQNHHHQSEYLSSDSSVPIDPSLLPQPYSVQRPLYQSYHSHLPPPYAPIDSTPQPSDLSYLPNRSIPSADRADRSSKRGRSSKKSKGYRESAERHTAMVYPPPPPPGGLHTPPLDQEKRVSLPSMGSWAPPPPLPSPHMNQASPGWKNGPPPMNLPGWREQAFGPELNSTPRGAKRCHGSDAERRPSDAEEVEAGLALAGLGLGLTAGEMKSRRDSVTKKVKTEDEKPAKDGRKSCSECRRLKAKCDRVFPCSNCASENVPCDF